MDLEYIKKEIRAASDLKELDNVHHKYLGRKGSITLELRKIGELPKEERAKKAPALQALKRDLEETIFEKSRELAASEMEQRLADEWIDATAPGVSFNTGHVHPLTHIQQEVNDIFSSLGFEIAEGPEVETEWYNFDALNIQKDHPARDLWDTFWLKPERQRLLLRTHTSPVQARYMELHQPPLRIIVPGRSFRHEASDASHGWQFYQLEGLMVGEDVSVAHLKAVIQTFLKNLFGGDVATRLRPSYFPFVEPGFEVDMSCTNCNREGCSVCSQTGWLEMLGAGMVHQNVFKAVRYNPKLWQGFAFGIGLDRIAMMKYKINDIRLLYEGDLRFLRQF